jgi:hypothetical protein
MVTVASLHVTDDQIRQFRHRQLSGDGLVRFADHLADCGECRDRVSAAGNAAAALSALQDGLGIGDEHVGEGDIQAFVGGDLDHQRRTAIEAHLAECRACAEDVADLSDFAAAFAHSRASRWKSAALATAAVLVLGVGAGLFWRGRTAPPATVERTDTLSALAPGDAAVVRDAIASKRLSLPSALSDLRGQRSPVLGDAAAPGFSLVSPIATVVLDTRPTLRWTALPRPTAYTVTVQDQATGATINSPPVDGTEWTPERPLVRGRTYAWQVGVSGGGTEVIAPSPPDPPARFMIADEATAARLAHLPASPLVRGVLYANAGLLDEAEREFQDARAHGERGERVDAFLAQLSHARLGGAPAPR